MILTEKIKNAITERAENGKARSFYLYDTSIMQNKMASLKTLLPAQVQIFYAMKANPHNAFLTTAQSSGAEGIEIASLGEGQKALHAGFKPSRIIFTGPGKSPEELEWAVQNKIKTVHVESLTEAHRLNQICEAHSHTQDILVRINPNFHIHGAQANFSGDSSKFGIDENQYPGILPQILALPNLNFKGLHVYSASGILNVDDLLENCRRVFTLARKIEAEYDGTHCDIIDFGGGFGIDYLESGADFNPETYAGELKKLIKSYGYENRKFVIELGRYLTADSGWYCTEILDIKESLGKKQIICAGGSHHFRRPVALGINHPLSVIPMNRSRIFDGQNHVENEHAFIGGPLCNSADKLAPKDVYIDHAEIGDMVICGLAGAYGLTMSHTDFLSHAHPPEYEI